VQKRASSISPYRGDSLDLRGTCGRFVAELASVLRGQYIDTIRIKEALN
jgi:hypothetical protein